MRPMASSRQMVARHDRTIMPETTAKIRRLPFAEHKHVPHIQPVSDHCPARMQSWKRVSTLPAWGSRCGA